MKWFFIVFLLSAGLLSAQESIAAYTTLEEALAKALFEQFQKETGVAVTFVRLSSGETVTRLEAEYANPKASIWVGGVGLDHISAKSKRLTTPYRSRYAAHTPAAFKDPEHYWIGLYVSPLTFITNLDMAKTLGISPPKSWDDLIKPQYKGYIRMADPIISGTAYNVITTIRTWKNSNESTAFEYLKKLDANVDQYARSGSAPGKSVAAGEVPIAIGYAHDQVKLKAEGANVEITAPVEGTGYELASMSLIKGGRNELNARRLYDWIIGSPSAQKLFTNWYLVLVADGAERHPLALSLNQLNVVKQDMLWDGNAANKDRLLERWKREIGLKR